MRGPVAPNPVSASGVELRYQAQIAQVIGVSRMQISRILRDITTTLRTALTATDCAPTPTDQPSPSCARLAG